MSCRRNAEFPQELAFSLDRPALLTQLQILSHEYKVRFSSDDLQQ